MSAARSRWVDLTFGVDERTTTQSVRIKEVVEFTIIIRYCKAHEQNK